MEVEDNSTGGGQLWLAAHAPSHALEKGGVVDQGVKIGTDVIILSLGYFVVACQGRIV
jgi:hypothetical protein